MQETPFDQNPPSPSRRRGRGLAVAVAALVLAGLGGAAWVGWQQGWIKLDPLTGAPSSPPATEAAVTPVQTTTANLAATDAAIAAAAIKVSALEQRLAELNQQAMAASGQASHAEALLIAFAARRAVDRGQPLGYLENQLRIRFGDSQANAVGRVISAAGKPVTLASLGEDFVRLEPQLAGGSQSEGGWDWFSRQVGELFVIRHDDMPSPTPESRIERARQAIAGGRIDAAIAEVERMPGKDAATEWLAHARDWVMTQHSLDQLETAALAAPVPAAVIAAKAAEPVPPAVVPAPEASGAITP